MIRPTKRLRNSIIVEAYRGMVHRGSRGRRRGGVHGLANPRADRSGDSGPARPGSPRGLFARRGGVAEQAPKAVEPRRLATATTTADGSSSPSADQGSATTGTPAAMASRILMGTPDPLAMGAMATRARRRNGSRSSTSPWTSIPGRRAKPPNPSAGTGAGQNPDRARVRFEHFGPHPVGKPRAASTVGR